MANLLMRYLEALRSKGILTHNTLTCIQSDLLHFGQYLLGHAHLENLGADIPELDKKIQAFTRIDAQEYENNLNEIYMPSTIKRKKSVLRNFFKYLCKENHTTGNPFPCAQPGQKKKPVHAH
jgi:site-specific recombinase XerD